MEIRDAVTKELKKAGLELTAVGFYEVCWAVEQGISIHDVGQIIYRSRQWDPLYEEIAERIYQRLENQNVSPPGADPEAT